jgi:hypothetical protein
MVAGATWQEKQGGGQEHADGWRAMDQGTVAAGQHAHRGTLAITS